LARAQAEADPVEHEGVAVGEGHALRAQDGHVGSPLSTNENRSYSRPGLAEGFGTSLPAPPCCRTSAPNSGHGNVDRHGGRRARAGGDRPGSLRGPRDGAAGHPRSEEHTSELQSQSNLVCRLLLEKKKIY